MDKAQWDRYIWFKKEIKRFKLGKAMATSLEYLTNNYHVNGYIRYLTSEVSKLRSNFRKAEPVANQVEKKKQEYTKLLQYAGWFSFRNSRFYSHEEGLSIENLLTIMFKNKDYINIVKNRGMYVNYKLVTDVYSCETHPEDDSIKIYHVEYHKNSIDGVKRRTGYLCKYKNIYSLTDTKRSIHSLNRAITKKCIEKFQDK